MSTSKTIKKTEQTLARLERNYAIERIKERKADTRRKIELGGLVIKAKMDEYAKKIILGALIDAFENLNKDKAYETLYSAKGEAAFMEFDKN